MSPHSLSLTRAPTRGSALLLTPPREQGGHKGGMAEGCLPVLSSGSEAACQTCFPFPSDISISRNLACLKGHLVWQLCGARRGRAAGRGIPLTTGHCQLALPPQGQRGETGRKGPRYLRQLLLRRKPQTKHRVGSAVGPLPELLRRFGESHIGCDCAVYNHLQEDSRRAET